MFEIMCDVAYGLVSVAMICMGLIMVVTGVKTLRKK